MNDNGKYKKLKLENENAKHDLAKLLLNKLYGKAASNTNSSFKLADVDKRGFIYGDTNSIYCDLPLEEIKEFTKHYTVFSRKIINLSYEMR